MELNYYQEKAMETCTESSRNFTYMSSNLVGEVGEFMGAIGKLIRKDRALISCNHIDFKSTTQDDDVLNLKKEAGDILWQLSGLCSVMGWNLEDIAELNLKKLASRKERGVIIGSGDDR